MNPNTLSFLVLFTIIAIIWVFDRKNFRRESPVFFLRRTERGIRLINVFAKAHKRMLKKFGDLAVILSFGSLGLLFVSKEQKEPLPRILTIIFAAGAFIALKFVFTPLYALIVSLTGAAGFIMSYLVSTTLSILQGDAAVGGVQFVLPFEVQNAPVFFIPIGYWLVTIFVILIVHEFSHALVSRAEGIRVKSLGYGFLAFLPLGFAEPDEKQLRKSAPLKKARVYAAGSFGNIIAAFIIFLVLLSISVAPAGAEYQSLTAGMSSVGVLPESGVITEINGTEIISIMQLANITSGIQPNTTISLVVDGKDYSLVTSPNPQNESQSHIGISEVRTKIEFSLKLIGLKLPAAFFYLYWLMMFMFMLSLGVALLNLLPVKPLDGGLLMDEILKRVLPVKWHGVTSILALFALSLLVFNLFGPYIL